MLFFNRVRYGQVCGGFSANLKKKKKTLEDFHTKSLGQVGEIGFLKIRLENTG